MGTAKFNELAAKRLAAAQGKIALLGNLGRSNYRATPDELREIVAALEASLEELRTRYRLPRQTTPAEDAAIEATAEREAMPASVLALDERADGGATIRSEIAWAIDAIDRKNIQLARNRLTRCLMEST